MPKGCYNADQLAFDQLFITVQEKKTHLEQIFVQWCRLEESKGTPPPSHSFPLPPCPLPLLLSPDKAAEEHSDSAVAV